MASSRNRVRRRGAFRRRAGISQICHGVAGPLFAREENATAVEGDRRIGGRGESGNQRTGLPAAEI